MSAHTEIIEPEDGVVTHREILKRNDTVVEYESDQQAIEAMLTNYRANSRVWFDNYTVQYPYMGGFLQTFTNLPTGKEEREELAGLVTGVFHEIFPVQYVTVADTYINVVGDGAHSSRAPKDWGSMKLN